VICFWKTQKKIYHNFPSAADVESEIAFLHIFKKFVC